jgi:hypothetical protein
MEEMMLSLFAYDMLLYISNTKYSIKKPIRSNKYI